MANPIDLFLKVGILSCIFSTVAAQNTNTFSGLLDTISRTRSALRDLELDALMLSMPFAEKNFSDVKFFLYTDKNPTEPQQLHFNDTASILSSHYDPVKPLKVLIHGYTQSLTSVDFPQKIKDAYLEVGSCKGGSRANYNVIAVDWSALSKEFNYFDSASYTKEVGRRVGQFLSFLQLNNFVSSYKSIHVVGFSLGAHVAGITGHYVQEVTGGTEKIGRITGLDPAGPYPSEPRTERLDASDAHFTDVIHTNMGSILLGDLGSTLLLGHVDFYPGGGRRQAGCEYSFFTEYSIPRRSTCSHLRAAEYFGNSIKHPKKYLGCQCESWSVFTSGNCKCTTDRKSSRNSTLERSAFMGEYVSSKARGKFYLHVK